ncbi:hypothetical protein [Dactylosporangium sp. CA-233914]|uniref:hypothetical protein n=1 Tax=Dactylosporangium sp. CA-233914 TaxID=3239934 RepID=UPI003D8A319A
MRYGGRAPGEPSYPGVPAAAQAELLALVAEVAARVGVARPDAVLLTGYGTIRSWASRRRRLLLVGLPLLQCLTVDEVRALVAHELAIVDHRLAHLVVRLRALHEEAVDPLSTAPHHPPATPLVRPREPFGEGPVEPFDAAAPGEAFAEGPDEAFPAGPNEASAGAWSMLSAQVGRVFSPRAAGPRAARTRAESIARATRDFAEALERKADQAASSASGLHTAARAVAKADLAAFEFADLAFDVEEQVWQRTSAGVQDLHAGWHEAVRAGAVVAALDDATRTALMARHPSLAGAISSLEPAHVALRAADSVPLVPLPPDVERELARHVLKRDSGQWVTFATVPSAEPGWPGWLDRQARAVTDQVATLLRRTPIGPAEVVEVLLTRLPELVAANWPAHPEPPAEPEELDGTPSVVVVAESALTAQGWRRVHPAAAGVLMSPDGEQQNLNLLARAALDSPAALAILLELLSRPGPAEAA